MGSRGMSPCTQPWPTLSGRSGRGPKQEANRHQKATRWVGGQTRVGGLRALATVQHWVCCDCVCRPHTQSVERAHSLANMSVVVIGGGISGLSAGNEALQLGALRVDVLEASDQLGGRLRLEEVAVLCVCRCLSRHGWVTDWNPHLHTVGCFGVPTCNRETRHGW